MVDHWEDLEFRVDSAGVVLELVGDFDTAGDWTVLGEFGLHLGGSGEAVVVGSIVVLVVNGPALVLAGLALWAWWPGAVLALVDGTAGALVEIVGNVLFT